MNFQSGYIKKICSFYSGDCHFTTMILPYLVQSIRQKTNIYTILDKNLQQYMDILLSKVNIDNNSKDEIRKLNWNKLNLNEANIEEYVTNMLKPNSEIILIIKTTNGNKFNKELMKIINEKIDYILENNIKLNFIVCYNIENMKSIDNIVSKYEYVLNTSGIHEIKEVFQCDLNQEKEEIENQYVG